jgi:Bacteriophage tail sheath protein
MPEYLSPGVYVEEVERGPRPIEGVSTSTTAFVGVTKRGPVNKPTLVTNIDQYQRFYAEFLGRDYGDNRYLPYAVQGFFANGGSRSYVLRVARLLPNPPDDQPPEERYTTFLNTNGLMFAQVAFADLPTRGGTAHRALLRDVPAGDGTQTESIIELGDLSGLGLGRLIRVGEGANAEQVRIEGFTAGRVRVTPAFGRAHTAGEPVRLMPRATPASNRTLSAPTLNSVGSDTVRVAAVAGLQANVDWLRIGTGPDTDYAQVTAITGDQVTIAPALAFSHPPTGSDPTPEPVAAFRAPAAPAPVQLQGATGPGTTNAERLVLPSQLAPGTVVLVEGPTGANDRAEIVTLGDRTPDGPNFRYVLTPPLRFNHNANANVTPLDAGATTELRPPDRIVLDANTNLQADDFVIVEDVERTEVVQLVANPIGNVWTTAQPVRFHHAANVTARRAGRPLTSDVTLSAVAGKGDRAISVPDTTPFQRGQVLQLLSGSRTEHATVLDRSAPVGGNVTLTLMQSLQFPHGAGTGVIPLTTGVRVIAGPNRPNPVRSPDPGVWGNGIAIGVEPASIARTTIAAPANPTDPFIDVVAAAGIESGSLLRLPGNRYGRVDDVDRGLNRVFLEPPGVPQGLTVSQGDVAGADFDVVGVQTVEFKLTLAYGPVVQILDESFDTLSMDPRHSRYFARIINGESPDPGSQLVHVVDLLDHTVVTPNATDVLPLPGLFYPAGGTDGLNGIVPPVFQGNDADDADRRTGLYALLNQSGISIVTVPGQTGFDVQSALVAHCERHKYSFAVLDSVRNASLDDIQLQRSRFDSTFAALYYPWVEIFDPAIGEQRAAFVPPSGHVAGIYARTDNEVGVFKAPANAIVNNVRDLERTITKAQQDVLNPKGINALRAFPGRGILVWGGRTVSTTNPLWRYVNVRRLFIYIEESIDLGSQYAPFQINDVPLWNRLKASVRAFLLGVWRDGGLQGATEEEAFFVRCGLGETMIGADILAGRVIIEVGVAPVRPAEFVIFRVMQIVRID